MKAHCLSRRTERLPLLSLRIVLFLVCSLALVGCARTTCADDFSSGETALRAEIDITELFSDDIQNAALRLKWHGARLTEDTLYAAALTGCSWEAAWGKEHLFVMDSSARKAAFSAALQEGQTKEAIAFALSLVLEPGQNSTGTGRTYLNFLERSGVDVNRVLLGILQAPDHLRGLPQYTYAAAALLAYRAEPRVLPFLLHLANSDDVYLRSRAVIGLGILAYQPQSGEAQGWVERLTLQPPQAFGLSVGERRLIAREIQEASHSDKYRLRAAAAIAIALSGDEEALPMLRKLAMDHAYVLSPLERGRNRFRQIVFPVRTAAAMGLARYHIDAETGNGEFTGRDLDKARRGGQDVSNDERNMRRDIACQLFLAPIDSLIAAPRETLREG